MTADTIALVQQHYDELRQHMLDVTQSFYAVLFARNPELRRLFPEDLAPQHTHFVASIDLAVDHLGKFPALDETLRQLGVKHIQYGAQPQHYFLARDAFLAALEQHSGDRWTPLVAEAWSAAIGMIASAMLRGAAMETARVADQLVPGSL